MELNRRNSQRAIIERTYQTLKTPAFQQMTLVAVKERLKLLRKSYDQMIEEHMRLIEGDVMPEDLEEQDDFLAVIEERYLSAVEIIQLRIQQLEREQIPRNEPAIVHQNEQPQIAVNEIRLEPIKMTNFSGNYRHWNEWRAMYDSLIHANERLTTTQKFHYLKRSITGNAEQVLSGWQITGENYNKAYNTLVNMFENRYRIIMAHLEELMSLEQCRTETLEGIRRLIDTTQRVMRQLNVIECPVAQWDNIIVYLLISRMAPKTLESWETTQDLRDMPLLEEVLKFLERRVRGISNLQRDQPNTSNGRPAERSNNTNNQKTNWPKTRPLTGNGSALSCHNCA